MGAHIGFIVRAYNKEGVGSPEKLAVDHNMLSRTLNPEDARKQKAGHVHSALAPRITATIPGNSQHCMPSTSRRLRKKKSKIEVALSPSSPPLPDLCIQKQQSKPFCRSILLEEAVTRHNSKRLRAGDELSPRGSKYRTRI